MQTKYGTLYGKPLEEYSKEELMKFLSDALTREQSILFKNN